MVGHDKFRHGLFQKTGPELVLFGLLCETQVPMLPRTLPIWQSIIDGHSHPFLRASGQVTTKEQGHKVLFLVHHKAILSPFGQAVKPSLVIIGGCNILELSCFVSKWGYPKITISVGK